MLNNKQLNFGAVVIGRNEGQRLRLCLRSISIASNRFVYVDSGSTDGSAQWARDQNVHVIDLNRPFTAARARNIGFTRLLDANPNVLYVQFVDADCELNAEWP